MTDKPQLFFEQTEYHEYGYDITRLVIQTGKATRLESLIAQCVGNKIGYYDNPGGPSGLETAAHMSRRYEWLLEQGFTGIHESTSYRADARIVMEWQHGRSEPGQYFEARISLPTLFSSIQASAKLLGQLVKARKLIPEYRYLQDPKYVLQALSRRKAIVLQEIKFPESIASSWTTELCYRESKPAVALQVAS